MYQDNQSILPCFGDQLNYLCIYIYIYIRIYSYIDKDSLLVLYKSFVIPHLEYCVQETWSPFLVKDKKLFSRRCREGLPN